MCPSSPTVTYFINDISQEEWIESVTSELRQHTDRPIKFRNKPRPGNEWWNKDIKEDFNIQSICKYMKKGEIFAYDIIVDKDELKKVTKRLEEFDC